MSIYELSLTPQLCTDGDLPGTYRLNPSGNGKEAWVAGLRTEIIF